MPANKASICRPLTQASFPVSTPSFSLHVMRKISREWRLGTRLHSPLDLAVDHGIQEDEHRQQRQGEHDQCQRYVTLDQPQLQDSGYRDPVGADEGNGTSDRG